LPDTLKQGMSRSEPSTQIRTDMQQRSDGGTKGSIVARGAKWNHNIHYHDVLLAAVPAACDRALDIGWVRSGGVTRPTSWTLCWMIVHSISFRRSPSCTTCHSPCTRESQGRPPPRDVLPGARQATSAVAQFPDLAALSERRDGDLNPGDGYPPTRSPGVPLRPLGHPSAGHCTGPTRRSRLGSTTLGSCEPAP
jgi:hypothetical protein